MYKLIPIKKPDDLFSLRKKFLSSPTTSENISSPETIIAVLKLLVYHKDGNWQ